MFTSIWQNSTLPGAVDTLWQLPCTSELIGVTNREAPAPFFPSENTCQCLSTSPTRRDVPTYTQSGTVCLQNFTTAVRSYWRNLLVQRDAHASNLGFLSHLSNYLLHQNLSCFFMVNLWTQNSFSSIDQKLFLTHCTRFSNHCSLKALHFCIKSTLCHQNVNFVVKT